MDTVSFKFGPLSCFMPRRSVGGSSNRIAGSAECYVIVSQQKNKTLRLRWMKWQLPRWVRREPKSTKKPRNLNLLKISKQQTTPKTTPVPILILNKQRLLLHLLIHLHICMPAQPFHDLVRHSESHKIVLCPRVIPRNVFTLYQLPLHLLHTANIITIMALASVQFSV